MVWNEIGWLLVFSQKNVKVLLSWLEFIYENVLKMHGHKFKNKKSFQKEEEDFEIKEDGRRRRDYPKA